LKAEVQISIQKEGGTHENANVQVL
jgi:hypothetical protein